ncbi:glutaredoxin [Fragilaria crotonensis]|nr:glutaredoxin [Fragilaria crotonensis]
MIADHIRENPVMLYMKGSPSAPMCGFSARVIQTLQEQEVDFASVDVLSYPEIREGVKKFSEWPTIPQLYVKGEFIGGCDIVTSMHESGELSDLLKDFKKSS